ncbi:ThiF family adenylyltransferase [Zoogloea oryzae]|uniref:ThiF family adenylyltransferase n=1 Tax=Zoogloea oryzae TaxID=310767 RepID=UPI0024E08AC3|nr:ThiF family adenylyltransferase [Zoogloea oryzae]
MGLDLHRVHQDFPDLDQTPLSRGGGATAYRLQLPPFKSGREFEWAELRLPKGFPQHQRAQIVLSPDAVLRIPHLDSAGVLCTQGDPGPAQGHSSEERILLLLQAYQEQFLEPWLMGALDDHFAGEALNYWFIKVARTRSHRDPVRAVWAVDQCPSRATVREGVLLVPERIVIAADEDLPITGRLVQTMGKRASQRIRVLIADIPIAHTLTPSTWPQTASDLDRLLNGRLRPTQRQQFRHPLSRRGRSIHRIVLLRNSEGAFAYLLPGGPATVVDLGISKKTYPPHKTPLPLDVSRLDPSWTVGRDQHPEVSERQGKHVLVFGAGALGSPVVDHLAKAGIGFITLVDPEILVPANIGRHLLGADSIGIKKAVALAQRVNLGYPASVVTPVATNAEQWLAKNSLSGVDVILDLTGEPDVRWHIDHARTSSPCPLLIGWMEPYVAAAHACMLPSETPWIQGSSDLMKDLEAITWPDEIMRQEPGCSSRFQSYTAAAAAHAVALIVENALQLIDGNSGDSPSRIVSWVRGQRFLDKHWPGLVLRTWAKDAAPHDGLTMERPFP